MVAVSSSDKTLGFFDQEVPSPHDPVHFFMIDRDRLPMQFTGDFPIPVF